MNKDEIIKDLAYKIFEIRRDNNLEGTELDDYLLAEGLIGQLVYLDMQITTQKRHKIFYSNQDEA